MIIMLIIGNDKKVKMILILSVYGYFLWIYLYVRCKLKCIVLNSDVVLVN